MSPVSGSPRTECYRETDTAVCLFSAQVDLYDKKSRKRAGKEKNKNKSQRI